MRLYTAESANTAGLTGLFHSVCCFALNPTFSFTLPQGLLLAAFAARRDCAVSALLSQPCAGSPASCSHPAYLDFPQEAFPCPVSPAPACLELTAQSPRALQALTALGAGWEANLPCQASLQKDSLRADGKGRVFSSQPMHLYPGRCSWPGNLYGHSTGMLTLMLFSLSRYPKDSWWLNSEQLAYSNPQQSKMHVNFVDFSTSLFFFSLCNASFSQD